MPIFYTDPSIAYRTVQGIQGGIDNYVRLRILQREQERREEEDRLRNQLEQLQIDEYKREQAQRAAEEEAVRGAIMPQGRQWPGFSSDMFLMGLPQEQQQALGTRRVSLGAGEVPPMRLNREAFLTGLGQQYPLAAWKYQQQFEASDAASIEAERQRAAQEAKDAADLAEKYSNLDKARRERFDWAFGEHYIPAAEHILSLPPEQRAQAWDGYYTVYSGRPDLFPEVRNFSPQYSPQMEQELKRWVGQWRALQELKLKGTTSDLVQIETTDAQGRRVIKFVRKEEGKEYPKPRPETTPRQPTEREEWMRDHPGAKVEDYWRAKRAVGGMPAAVETRYSQAKLIKEQTQGIRDMLNDPNITRYMGIVAGQAGPITRRVSADAQAFEVAMESLEALLPILHAYRGGAQTHQIFKKMAGNLTYSPESIRATLDQIDKLADNVTNEVERGYPGDAAVLDTVERRRKEAEANETLPPEATAQLKEGQATTFANGHVWTLKNGRPVRIQ